MGRSMVLEPALSGPTLVNRPCAPNRYRALKSSSPFPRRVLCRKRVYHSPERRTHDARLPQLAKRPASSSFRNPLLKSKHHASAEGWPLGAGASDPLVFGLTAVPLAAVAFGATAIPAWRASRIDPGASLRYQ